MRKIIEKALNNGYDKEDLDFLMDNYARTPHSLLCEHSFAKAFFGEEKVCPECGEWKVKEHLKNAMGNMLQMKSCANCMFDFIRYRAKPAQGIQKTSIINPNQTNPMGQQIEVQKIIFTGPPAWFFHLREAIIYEKGLEAYYEKCVEQNMVRKINLYDNKNFSA